uniref:SCP domain-containing protein n=1 Tax=Panagrellus redivivus TaxID=6233 RepID=A0A7E4WD66_PANRE
MRSVFLLFLALVLVQTANGADCTKYTPGTAADLTSTPTACGSTTTNAPFNDADRQNLLARLNLYRAQLANGCAVQKNGQYAPSGSNVIELTYNCTLEQQAQAWTDQCQFGFSPDSDRPGAGQTVYGVYSNGENLGNIVAVTMDNIWNSLQNYGNFTSNNTQLVDGNLATWAQLAWGKTSSFGCAYAKCPNAEHGYLHTIICNYYPGGDALNTNIYEPGPPCKVNSDCTSPGYGQCDSNLGLCQVLGTTTTTPVPTTTTTTVAPTQGPCVQYTPGTADDLTSTPTACSGTSTNALFNDADRQSILARLNLYRAQLANGCAVQKDGQYAPSGSNIIELTYNCTLEQQAQTWADQCQFGYSPSSDRPGVGQTVYGLLSSSENIGNAVASSIDALWKTLETYGNFTSNNTQLTDSNLAMWAQLAWGTTASFGCAYKKCPNTQYGYLHTIICNFYPGGVYSNINIYQPGLPCKVNSDCTSPGYGQCDSSLGLCQVFGTGSTGTTVKASTSTTAPTTTTTTIAPTTTKASTTTTTTIPTAVSACAQYTPGVADDLSTPTACGSVSTNAPFNDANRQSILARLNLYRAQLANGCAVQKDGQYAPSGINIIELTYNCTLEQKAQAWADQCQFAYSPSSDRPGIGQILYGFFSDQDDIGNAVASTIDALWNTLKDHGNFTSNNTLFTDSDLSMWAQLAWGKTSSFGCAYAKCPNSQYGYLHTIICNFYPGGVISNTSIYQPGSPCKVNSDCTSPGYGQCDSNLGLCQVLGASTNAPITTTTPIPMTAADCEPYTLGIDTTNPTYFNVSETCDGTNTGSGFSATARTSLVNRHNQWRSQLAHGCSLMPNNTYAPPAKNMLKMVYNCSIEPLAQEWANNCEFKHSGRSGYGENLWAVFTKGNFNQNAFADASDSWWSELIQYGGINSTDTILTSSNYGLGIGHWSQMAWYKSTAVGCGFAKCPRSDDSYMYIVVCNYWLQGNIMTYPIYKIGQPCKQDSDCTVAGYGKCEVSTGLCATA